jgi:hypothetical protein
MILLPFWLIPLLLIIFIFVGYKAFQYGEDEDIYGMEFIGGLITGISVILLLVWIAVYIYIHVTITGL